MKRKKTAIVAIVLALVIAFAPMAAFAAENDDAYEGYEAYEQETQEVEAISAEPEAQEDNPFAWLTDALRGAFGEVREVTLTPKAMEIVLYDFDYLVAKILDVAPTQNIIERRIGITAEEFFAAWREIIEQNFPVPSVISIEAPDVWGEVREDDLSIAADYLFTILIVIGELELGGLGHMLAQYPSLIEQTFLAVAHAVHNDMEVDQDVIDYYLAQGYTLEEIEEYIEAWVAPWINFAHFRYEIYNTPSVLWFYSFDPSAFDLDADLSEVLGFMDPDNITTAIIEADRIAYFRIASFSGNLDYDSQTLFPFFEEIQDFEHLIIDLRGNGGGWANYFADNVVSMLIDEPIVFEAYEFYIASERTAVAFELPPSMLGGVLYDVFPAAQFVQDRNMQEFNQQDLALLDYAIIWHVEIWPVEDNIPFGGEIWLLVDGGSASASDNAATLSISTGFATVVGEPTAGVTGVIYTYAALPNTGILFRIDLGYTVIPSGHSIEEFGVIPQIPNAPGMDALETVLALISGYELPTYEEWRADFEALIAEIFGIQHITPIPPPPSSLIFPSVPRMTFNGVDFVSIRSVAEVHGYTVEWSREKNSVVIISADGNSRVVRISAEGTFNANGTVFVAVDYAARIFADSVYISPLTGTWAWDEDNSFIYIFNADGTGQRGFPLAMENFTWSTNGTRLNIDLLGELSLFALRNERWTFSINGDVLTLESLQVDGMVFNYIKQ